MGLQGEGWRTAYLLLDDILEYNKGICYGFDWMWREVLGGEVVGHDVYQNDDPSIQAQVDRIRALPEEPDIIENCSYIPGGASAIKQIRAAGINAPIGGGSSMTGTYWQESVPGLSGHFVPEQASIYGDDPRPAVQEFLKKYEAKFGEPGEQPVRLPRLRGVRDVGQGRGEGRHLRLRRRGRGAGELPRGARCWSARGPSRISSTIRTSRRT